jgi:hypothetical protein
MSGWLVRRSPGLSSVGVALNQIPDNHGGSGSIDRGLLPVQCRIDGGHNGSAAPCLVLAEFTVAYHQAENCTRNYANGDPAADDDHDPKRDNRHLPTYLGKIADSYSTDEGAGGWCSRGQQYAMIGHIDAIDCHDLAIYPAHEDV